ncbi:hydroxyacyl glutathione hydrolase [Globomyces pollinis-pini]|nr:hydroxyacyl glutathione hydrolase [Globomyces pollinis-pini]
MKVTPISIFKDNYSYLLQCTKTNTSAIVDPAVPKSVLEAIGTIKPNALFTTHHHYDHSAGNQLIAQTLPGITVYGGDDRIPELTVKLSHKQSFKLGELDVTALVTPGHTMGSVSYYVVDPSTNESVVFTGDTLFIGGCGRFFEGTKENMFESLISILGTLPDSTKVYCGHEYTTSNLQFGISVEPNNQSIQNKLKWSQTVDQTIPSTIEDEKKTNVFMRVNEPELLDKFKQPNGIELMGLLREMKNNF